MSGQDNKITAEDLRKRLEYDQHTGVFLWRHRKASTSFAGTLDERGYRRIKIDGKLYAAHRLAWLYLHGSWPQHGIDHVNGIRDDNRIANLRDVPQSVNVQNLRRPRKDSSHEYAGVHRERGKFSAQISVNRKSIWLGMFDTPEQAHQAYLAAKREYHEGFTL